MISSSHRSVHNLILAVSNMVILPKNMGGSIKRSPSYFTGDDNLSRKPPNESLNFTDHQEAIPFFGICTWL